MLASITHPFTTLLPTTLKTASLAMSTLLRMWTRSLSGGTGMFDEFVITWIDG
jgi:hypothetical protein